ncbi:YdeI/OmpD-associated family protein [Larkinella harenae]
MEKPLVDGPYRLKKFPGKGGWTYAELPEVSPDKKAYFNWVKVRGLIDDYEIKSAQLMPMGNGRLFLAVKTEIRKQIGKQEGDWVHITLYPEQLPVDTRKDLLICLEDEPAAQRAFLNATADEQKAYIDWIDAVKSDDAKIERMAQTIERLLKRQKI